MTIDVTDGHLNEVIMDSIHEHLDIPLRALVALQVSMADHLGRDSKAAEIAAAGIEDTVVEYVTGALALVGVAFELAGVEFPPDQDSEKSTMWAGKIVNDLIERTRLQFVELSLDYLMSVGPIPTRKGQ